LKKKGYITGLGTGTFSDDKNIMLYEINLVLTETGFKNPLKVA